MKKNNYQFCIQNKSNNKYYFNQEKGQFLICHPILFDMLNRYNNGQDIESWFNSIKSESEVKLDNSEKFTNSDIKYYYEKFNYLKNHNYFNKIKATKNNNQRLTANDICSQLANTPQVTFEVTEHCNLNCVYCAYGTYYSNYETRNNQNMDISSAKNLLKYIKHFWNSNLNQSYDTQKIISFYGGEPLLNFKLIKEIVDYSKQLQLNHNSIGFSMTTNGVLLEQHIDYLVKNNFSLLISLDGPKTANSYRLFHNNKKSFDLVFNNIKNVQKKYPEYFEKNINFNAVLHNKSSISEIYWFFKKEFNKKPSISELSPDGIADDQKQTFLKTYANLNEKMNKAKDKTVIENDMFADLPNINEIALFLHRSCDFSFADYNDLISNNCQNCTPTGTCIPFLKKIFVTAKGNILPCERIGHEFSLGKVYKEKIDLNFKVIAETYNRYYNKISKLCSSCFNSKNCPQCIFYLDINSKQPKCNSFESKNEFKSNLSNISDFIETNQNNYKRLIKDVTIVY